MKTILLLITVLILSFTTAFGQDRQVCMDLDNKVQYIDSELEQQLQLFPEYDNFREARIFQLTDSTYTLEVSYMMDNQLSRIRKILNKAELQEFRRKVTSRLAENIEPIRYDQSGRSMLLISSTVLSSCFYGWAVPVSLHTEDPKVNTALYLLTSAGGFFLPYYLTKNKPVSEGAAEMYLGGSLHGMLHGAMFSYLADADSFESYIGVMTLTSIAESIIAYNLAHSYDLGQGKARVINTLGTYGALYGLSMSKLFDVLDVDNKAWSLLVLGGSISGFIAGNYISNCQNYTTGDADLLASIAGLSAYLPLSLLVMAENDDPDAYALTFMAGATAGFFLGDYMVQGRDFTESQGIYMALGASAGTLLGMGLGYLIAPEEGGLMNSGPDIRYILPMGAAGGFIALLGLYYSFEEEAGVNKDIGRLDIRFNPTGLTSMFIDSKARIGTVYNVPILQMSYKLD